MNTDASKASATWRSLALVVAAFGALAVAIWLVPASIHIVKWPVGGPVRLALLAPAWQLAALLAAGLVAAAIVWWARREAALTLTPFAMLWLWAVPYLPWVPDRLPLLLVLAGPIKWVILAAAVVGVVASYDVIDRIAAALLRVGRRTVFAASLLVCLGLGLYSARTLPVGGDEPHYLVIVESILRDGDLRIENNHQRRDYASFYPAELRPDFFERGTNGEIYSIHAPGLPVLILPAYAIGGRMAVVAFLAWLAALTALAVFDLADALAGRGAALATWAATCLTVPFLPHAWLIFPELPGALIVAWAALWLWQPIDRPAWLWALRGAALGALPWLHTKFIVFLMVFAVGLAWRLRKRSSGLAAFPVPLIGSVFLWLYSFYAIYGSFNPEAPYGAYTGIYVLTENIPHGLIGIFFDQKFGLLFYSPIYLAAIAGAWIVMRRSDTQLLGAVLLLVVAAFVGSTARLYMFWGGNSAPARFLVPLLPCLAPLLALAFSQARAPMSRALAGVWLTVSLGIAIAGVGWPDRLMLFSDPHGRARVLEFLQAGSPLARVVPTFTDPDWASQTGQFAAWLAAAAVSWGAMAIMSKRTRAGALGLAGVGCLTFLFVGSIVTTRVSADVRDETARRGDLDVLWRFDGNRFRTLDYETLSRAAPERLEALTTISVEPRSGETAGPIAGPFTLPPGSFQGRVWFADSLARNGEVEIDIAPRVALARVAGAMSNPTILDFDLPMAARRLTVQVRDAQAATAVRRIEIAPRSVVAAGDRRDIPTRAVESLPGREGAYMVYTDEHAYPENGVFWSRGTATTQVLIAPAGASRIMLTLSTGPKSGLVSVSVGGLQERVNMSGGELKVVSFDLPPGQPLVPVTIGSDVMFRPAEVDGTSTDKRGLGCQVRINLE